MDLAAFLALIPRSLDGVQGDVFTVVSSLFSILIVIAGGRIIYWILSSESRDRAGYDAIESDYQSLVEAEDKKWHRNRMINNARLEVQDRHKWDM